LTLVFSSSSPLVSVALFDSGNACLSEHEELANNNASGACIRLMERCLMEAKVHLDEVQLFVADVGPGSFIGTRVCVTMAKTLAFAQEKNAGGLSAFDLVSASSAVAIPSRKGEYFLRIAGGEPVRTNDPYSLATDVVGYGAIFEVPTYPKAGRFSSVHHMVSVVQPEFLLPQYLIEPSISTPKQPYGSRSGN
jgi:tRNA threonylcarbamoyl adenosine modification protein YeaZ